MYIRGVSKRSWNLNFVCKWLRVHRNQCGKRSRVEFIVGERIFTVVFVSVSLRFCDD
jgi:hypothetical protein